MSGTVKGGKKRASPISKNMVRTFIKELVKEEVRKAVMEVLVVTRSAKMG